MAKIRRMPFFEVVSTPQSKPRVTLPLNRPPQTPATEQAESGQLAGQQTHTPPAAAETQTSPAPTGETRQTQTQTQTQTQPSSSQPSQSRSTLGEIRNIRNMKETDERTQSVIQEPIGGSEEVGAYRDGQGDQDAVAVDEPEGQARVSGDRVVSVSTNTILIWVAVMVVLCVGFYMLGVNQGQRM